MNNADACFPVLYAGINTDTFGILCPWFIFWDGRSNNQKTLFLIPYALGMTYASTPFPMGINSDINEK